MQTRFGRIVGADHFNLRRLYTNFLASTLLGVMRRSQLFMVLFRSLNPLRFYVGCPGWRNVPWKASFYPASIDVSNYLTYYSARFDVVEVNLSNSLFEQNGKDSRSGSGRNYPDTNVVRRWAKQTPEDFHFSIRIPRALLFSKLVPKSNQESIVTADLTRLDSFLQGLSMIKEKIITLTANVPRYLTLGEGREWLETMLNTCASHRYSVALQFDNRSWYQDLTYNILRKHGASIIWPYNISRPYADVVSISNGLYFRTKSGTNNSNIGESNQPDFTQASDSFSRLLDLIRKKSTEEKNIDYAIIVVEKPAHAALIQKMLGIGKRPAQEMTLSKSGSIAHDQKGVNQRVIACVDLNAFYPSCEELRNPGLRGKPNAVIMTDQREGDITLGVVSSCSYEARKYGVRSAMALARAKSLCPDLILLPVDIPYYSKVSDQVMSTLEPFGDVLEQASIDEAFLDCTTKVGDVHNPENLRQLGHSIKQAIKEKCGLLCSVGIAPTKSASKIASDYEKPDGLTVVTSAELKSFLAPLETNRVSGIGPKTEEALKQMEIGTLGQLASADVQTLLQRFGKNGQWMWKVANGLDNEPVAPRGDHVSISTETTMESSSRDRNEIQGILQDLVTDIHDRAMHYGYSFRTVGLRLVRSDFSVESRETTYPEPQRDKSTIESVLEPLLNKFEFSDSQPAVRKVGLKLSRLARSDVIASTHKIEQPWNHAMQKSMFDYT